MNRIKELRMARGYTIRSLGEKIGLTHSQISQLETGARNLTSKNAIKFADFFGVSVDYLLGRTPEDIFNDAADSISDAFTDIKFDKDGDPYPTYKKGISPVLQQKESIVEKLKDIDDEEFLAAIFTVITDYSNIVFADTTEEHTEFKKKYRAVANIIKRLSLADNETLDVVIQILALQKTNKGDAETLNVIKQILLLRNTSKGGGQ